MARPVKEIFVFLSNSTDKHIGHYDEKTLLQKFLPDILSKYKGVCIRMEFHPFYPSFSNRKKTCFKTEADEIQDENENKIILGSLPDGTIAFPSEN